MLKPEPTTLLVRAFLVHCSIAFSLFFLLPFVNLSVNEFSIIINREMQNNHTVRVFKHEKHTFNPFYCP